nr:hypothetical protein [Rhodococcus sp. HNM0569]
MTLIALAVAAAAAPLALVRRVPAWAAGALSAVALLVAWAASGRVAPVHGVALAATFVLTVLAAAAGGGPLVIAVFRFARRQPDAGPLTEPGPLRGGRVIGWLERAAVAAAVLSGWPEGIAIVLAVKGLARYPELRVPNEDRQFVASEQFIIGTFTSVLWALAVAGIGRGLLI